MSQVWPSIQNCMVSASVGSRPPAPSVPGPDPGLACPGAMSPGLLMLLGSAVLVVFGLCCTFVHRARSRYEHIPGPPRPR
ncbi:hypothetical protein J1605_020097 [Eschrichtius robustus]|uniref:Uncharacterized protein n=1 Tax=Eschrichtius robustus TaxID=9764 RepID=A0AB34HMM4_ESCRO|nr:hypothetical protein J1605_020097 [Eschrichtius robustus]